jgi:hypothetical protein
VAFLEQKFKDHAIRDKAIAKLNTIRQFRCSFQELLTEFDRLLLEAGDYGWDDTVKKGYFRAAINNELRERLITMDEARPPWPSETCCRPYRRAQADCAVMPTKRKLRPAEQPPTGRAPQQLYATGGTYGLGTYAHRPDTSLTPIDGHDG